MPLNKSDVIQYLTETFDLDERHLEDDLPLFSSSLLDSTSMVSLVMFLENQTGIFIEANDLTLENFDTISKILAFCNSRVA